MAQARTDAQPSRATRGLMVLGDDCVLKMMTFLAVADARRGVGAAAKSLRTTAMSTTLERTRFSEPYTLRGDKHVVVHAMATGCGLRQWATRAVRVNSEEDAVTGAVPPARLGITIHRVSTSEPESFADMEPYASYLASGIVDPDVTRGIGGGGECELRTDSWVQYELPCQLQVTAFSFGFFNCGARYFTRWTFEAFDGEDWRQLYYSADSPWPDAIGYELTRPVVFRLSGAADFASTRFRIRMVEQLEEHRCMHIRGLELFGKILPPW
jgi:hypothetical protein